MYTEKDFRNHPTPGKDYNVQRSDGISIALGSHAMHQEDKMNRLIHVSNNYISYHLKGGRLWGVHTASRVFH